LNKITLAARGTQKEEAIRSAAYSILERSERLAFRSNGNSSNTGITAGSLEASTKRHLAAQISRIVDFSVAAVTTREQSSWPLASRITLCLDRLFMTCPQKSDRFRGYAQALYRRRLPADRDQDERTCRSLPYLPQTAEF
jgi:hypothetical protein